MNLHYYFANQFPKFLKKLKHDNDARQGIVIDLVNISCCIVILIIDTYDKVSIVIAFTFLMYSISNLGLLVLGVYRAKVSKLGSDTFLTIDNSFVQKAAVHAIYPTAFLIIYLALKATIYQFEVEISDNIKTVVCIVGAIMSVSFGVWLSNDLPHGKPRIELDDRGPF